MKEPFITAKRLVKLLRIPRGEEEPCAIAAGTLDSVNTFLEMKLLDKWELEFKFMGNHAYKGFYKETPFILATGGESASQSARNTEIIAQFSDFIIRVDTSAAISEKVTTGDIIIVTGCYRDEGTTTPFYVEQGYAAVADYDITTALIQAAEKLDISYHLGQVGTLDASLKQDDTLFQRYNKMNILATDTGTSSVLTVAHILNKKAGAILSVFGDMKIDQVGYTNPKFFDAEMNVMKISLEAMKILDEKFREEFEQSRKKNLKKRM